MNVKVLSWIIIALVVGVIAIQLFVPQTITEDGKVKTFGGNAANPVIE